MFTGLANAQPDSALADIRLPAGFTIDVYTDQVPDARSLALGANGTVFVATRREGRVYAVVNEGSTWPTVVTIADGLKTPNGIAYRDGTLYVAETTRLLRFPAIDKNLREDARFEMLYDSFPSERHHGWRYIDFGPDGKLYMSIGAPCNVCDRDGFGTIVRMQADGSGPEVVAYGVRNSVGFAWHPETGELWFTDNGRDMLGDDLPPGELNRLRVVGQHFGFPYCHGGEIPDPEFGSGRDCSEFEPPAQKLGPHVAPLGILFYQGEMFPEQYRHQVLIAEHGSWNRSEKIGYRISLVRLADSRSTGYEVFADGWLNNGAVSGRPVDLLEMPDGSVLVSDDQAGKLYRIRYTLPLVEPLSAE
ncbi:MAG: sorbosone dehydrogenase family protein [Gammaproteobacteria bacterium]|nr:sorbosone dehydrogenase family protein [Gammaproteobacteria bacterium]